MLSNAFTPSFVARYTPSSELNILAKKWHKMI